MSLRDRHDIVGRAAATRGPTRRTSAPINAPIDEQRPAHVEAAVADVRVGERVVRLAARLVHREEVGEHLRRVPLVGEAVVDRHAGVGGQLLDVGLGGAAELDGVVHPPEHAGGVGHRLLVPELGARGIEVGHVGALVERGDLERARVRVDVFSKISAISLPVQSLGLGARVLGGLEGLRRAQQVPQLLWLEVDLLEEAPVAQVVHVGVPFRRLNPVNVAPVRSGE